MPKLNYSKELLDLEDVIITNIVTTDGKKTISVELERKMQTCPRCHQQCNTIQDYRHQKISDLALQGKEVELILKKRRYRCPHCGKRFQEANSFLGAYKRQTNRAYQYMISLFADPRSCKSIADECHCSAPTAARAFDKVKYPLPRLPKAIAIDEFKGNTGGHKFQCILADPETKQLLDILPSRNSEELYGYFSQFSIQERQEVRYVVMDMSIAFKSIMKTCFPKAQIVADKFHVCRQVTWALERVRKNVQKSFDSSKRKYFKRSRWLLLKHFSKLTAEEKDQLAIMLQMSEELTAAYGIKEAFYTVMASGNKLDAQKAYKVFEQLVLKSKIQDFTACLETFGRWYGEIMAAFESGYSNGYVEGCNNMTKVLKRACFGLKSFNRLRNRRLYMANSK